MPEIDAVILTPRYAPRITPTPIPGVGVFDTPAVCITINHSWVSHLLGLLDVLDQPDAWVGDDLDIFNARQQVRELALALRLGNCEDGTPMLLRQNETLPCILERSIDDGVTWEPFADLTLCQPPGEAPPYTHYDDIRIGPVSGEPEVSLDGGTTWTPVPQPSTPGWFPARSPSPGDTQEEQRCAAASRATDNLSRWYQATYGQIAANLFTTTSAIMAFNSRMIDLLAGIAFGSYYEISKVFLGDGVIDPVDFAAAELDQEAREALVCLLYDNATVGEYQVVSFDYNAVRNNVISALGINPGTAVWTHLNYLGEDGLNAFGEAGFGAGYDCVTCSACPGYVGHFTSGFGDQNAPATFAFGARHNAVGGTWSATGGFSDPGSIRPQASAGEYTINRRFDLGEECTVVNVNTWTHPLSVGALFVVGYLYNASGTLVATLGQQGINTNNNAWKQHGWSGNWNNVRYITLVWFSNPQAQNYYVDDITITTG